MVPPLGKGIWSCSKGRKKALLLKVSAEIQLGDFSILSRCYAPLFCERIFGKCENFARGNYFPGVATFGEVGLVDYYYRL